MRAAEAVAGVAEAVAADPVVAGIIDRGEVDQVNALLRTWTKNAQPVPDGLPADLRDFIESARQLPTWADHAKLEVHLRRRFDPQPGPHASRPRLLARCAHSARVRVCGRRSGSMPQSASAASIAAR